MVPATALILGGVVSLISSVLILTSLAHYPRIWIGDAPRQMQRAAMPLTSEEKRLRVKWAIPILSSLVVVIPAVTWLIHRNRPLSYGEAFSLMWIAWMVFNLVDLVIIDWLIAVWWQPRWSVIKEVEHLYHLNTYGFHFRAFLTGTAAATIASALLACVVFL